MHRALVLALRAALVRAQHPGADLPLQPLPDKGLAHDHVRLLGSGLLARVPKQSQIGWDTAHNLVYQTACFERAAAGGHTPVLHAVLPPTQALPWGALLVDEVVGRTAQLPGDLTAMAQTLASLHAQPLPKAEQRPPLLNPGDPLQALADEIGTQAQHLAAARLEPAVGRFIQHEILALRAACARPERPAQRLIAFDGHPGNFIVRADGRAVLVDLEKCRYSYPALDLAHATLYTSTTWDLDSCTTLTQEQVLSFYAAWQAAMAAQGAVFDRGWHLPLRRAMWLWSITWCAKWRVLSGAARAAAGQGEDWSAEASDASLVAHVRGRVDHYLSEDVVQRVVHGFDTLEPLLCPA